MKAGVTGHQIFKTNEGVRWISMQMKNFIRANNISMGYTCLAKGADQIFAKALLELDIPYTALIPSKDYAYTFAEGDKDSFDHLREKAKATISLEFAHSSERAYLHAGQVLVGLSDVLVAVWDGKPAKGMGGTADIVHFALATQKRVFHINPDTEQQQWLA